MYNETVYVSGMGEAFIPGRYFADIYQSSPLRRFELYKSNYGKAFKFLKNGGAIILSGKWEDIIALYRYVEGRDDEFLRNTRDKKQRLLLTQQLRQRMLVPLETVPVKDSMDDPGIITGLVGEKVVPSKIPVLVPVNEAEKLYEALNTLFFTESVGVTLRTHPDVLVPRSKETIALMCRAIGLCRDSMPSNPEILDMGCGSGVLTIAASKILKDLKPCVTATDILLEAVALTRLNVKHFSVQRQPGAVSNAENGIITAANGVNLLTPDEYANICVTDGGDLFTPVSKAMFNLIIFNAPWIKAPARNKAELALNDDGQKTIERFLNESANHLLTGGKVIVGYSDNSGPKAVESLERFIRGAGLRITDILKDRIKTYSSNKPWQNIFAYILSR